MHTTHMSKSHSRGGSHVSQRRDDNKAMQREINDLKKNYVTRNRSGPLLVLMALLMMKMTLATGEG